MIPSLLITSPQLELSRRTPLLLDISTKEASNKRTSILMVQEEETMKSWLEEHSLIPDSSTRWSTRLVLRLFTSQVARNSPSSMLLPSIKLKVANLLSLLAMNMDQDPPEIGLLSKRNENSFLTFTIILYEKTNIFLLFLF